MEQLIKSGSEKHKLLLNSNIINKQSPSARGWGVESITIKELIEHISNGHAFSFGVTHEMYPDTKPFSNSIALANGFALDIDNTITQDVKKRTKTEQEGYLSYDLCVNDKWLSQNAAFIYQTASYTEQHHKFRIVFLFEEPIYDSILYKKIVQSFIKRFDSDSSCCNIDRIWFGSTNCKYHIYNMSNRISKAQIEESIRIEESGLNQNGINNNQVITSKMAESMLRYIPAQMNYMDWLKVISAIGNHFDLETAFSLIEAWSPDTIVGTRKKLQNRLSNISIGTLVYYAQSYGYVFPKQIALKSNNQAIKETETQELKYELNDSGNANRLLARYSDSITYNCESECWFIWNGKIWEFDQANYIEEMMKDTIKNIDSEIDVASNAKLINKLLLHKQRSGDHSKLRSAIKATQSKPSVVRYNKDYDGLTNIISLNNGYYNLKTHKLENFQPELLITKMMDVEYNPDAKAPEFEKFLSEIFLERKELINYVIKLLGISLDGNMDIHKVIFCIGNGRNGKSVFFQTIFDLFGNYSEKLSTEAIFKGNKASNHSDIQIERLQGKRLITFGEIPYNRKLDESTLKDMTSGESVNGRGLYSRDINFRPQALYWIPGNYLPIIEGTDEGIWRRIIVIPFDYSVPSDKEVTFSELLTLFKSEYSGILNLALKGYKMYQEEGLNPPLCVENALNTYRYNSDLFRDFLNECCEIDKNKKCIAKELYQEYREYASTNGNTALSNQKFYQRLEEEFDILKEKRSGGRNFLIGIDILKAEDVKAESA